jgi:hypothetical protein
MCATMEKQRVRKSDSTFAPSANNFLLLEPLSQIGFDDDVLQSQACCQLHQGAIRLSGAAI